MRARGVGGRGEGLLGCRPIRGGVVIRPNLIGHNLAAPAFEI